MESSDPLRQGSIDSLQSFFTDSHSLGAVVNVIAASRVSDFAIFLLLINWFIDFLMNDI